MKWHHRQSQRNTSNHERSFGLCVSTALIVDQLGFLLILLVRVRAIPISSADDVLYWHYLQPIFPALRGDAHLIVVHLLQII